MCLGNKLFIIINRFSAVQRELYDAVMHVQSQVIHLLTQRPNMDKVGHPPPDAEAQHG